MNRVSVVRTFSALAVGSALLVGTGVFGVASASAAKSPKIVVSPWNGVKNNQTLKVSGSGFKAHDTVYIVECLSSATGGAQCNTLGATMATINAKGQLAPTKFKVITGKIGNGKCGTALANRKGCDVSVGNATGGDSATAKIVFVAPKTSKK